MDFGARDVAAIEGQKLLKSDMFAVHMAKPLEENLHAYLLPGRTFRAFLVLEKLHQSPPHAAVPTPVPVYAISLTGMITEKRE